MNLTYEKNRGYWHWVCVKCGAQGKERIPDQAYLEWKPALEAGKAGQKVRRVIDGYIHNPGNPALLVCPSCDGGQPYRFCLNGASESYRRDGHRSSADGDGVSACSYELLEEPWLTYSRLARRYAARASLEDDREDLTQDILAALVKVHRKRGDLSVGEMRKTAWYEWMAYLRKKGRRPAVASLNRPAYDDGKEELWQTIADKAAAVDLDAWMDAQAQLTAYPPRALELAAKRASGEPLTTSERCSLWRYRKKEIPSRPAPDTGIGRFAEVITQLVADGCGSYRIWRKLQGLGYEGSRSAVKYYLAGERARRWRRESKRRLKLKQKEA
jgi:hypothetical protein